MFPSAITVLCPVLMSAPSQQKQSQVGETRIDASLFSMRFSPFLSGTQRRASSLKFMWTLQGLILDMSKPLCNPCRTLYLGTKAYFLNEIEKEACCGTITMTLLCFTRSILFRAHPQPGLCFSTE